MGDLKLDGRTFEGITEGMTARQDDYILTQLRRSGAMDVLAALPKDATDEQRKDGSREMFARIVETGRKFKLLAGLLTETGKTWTEAEAERNAARFGDITDTADKMTMNGEIMTLTMNFFLFGAGFSRTSPNYSTAENAAPATESEEAKTLETLTK